MVDNNIIVNSKFYKSAEFFHNTSAVRFMDFMRWIFWQEVYIFLSQLLSFFPWTMTSNFSVTCLRST